MTPIEARIKCVEFASGLHIQGVQGREEKVLASAQNILNFVTDNGTLSDPSADEFAMSALNGISGMITGLSAANPIVPEPAPVEDGKIEKKAKVVKTPAEGKPEA